jgi:hypothetical protein
VRFLEKLSLSFGCLSLCGRCVLCLFFVFVHHEVVVVDDAVCVYILYILSSASIELTICKCIALVN